jgi:hypothetical protein
MNNLKGVRFPPRMQRALHMRMCVLGKGGRLKRRLTSMFTSHGTAMTSHLGV